MLCDAFKLSTGVEEIAGVPRLQITWRYSQPKLPSLNNTNCDDRGKCSCVKTVTSSGLILPYNTSWNI